MELLTSFVRSSRLLALAGGDSSDVENADFRLATLKADLASKRTVGVVALDYSQGYKEGLLTPP